MTHTSYVIYLFSVCMHAVILCTAISKIIEIFELQVRGFFFSRENQPLNKIAEIREVSVKMTDV